MSVNRFERIQGITAAGSRLVCSGAEQDLQIRLCSPGIINIRCNPEVPYGEVEKIILDREDWPEFTFDTVEGDPYQIVTEELTVKIYRAPFRIEFWDRMGKLLLSSQAGGMAWAGEQATTDAAAVQAAFAVGAVEHFYGLGDGGDGFDRRGTERRIWSGHTAHIGSEIPAPFVISTNGYGLFFHNPYEAKLSIGADLLSYEAQGGNLDFYFLYGPSIAAIIRNYYELLGYPPLLPKWAFGFQQSFRHFINSQEVMDLPKDLRARGIPCDHLTFLSTYSKIHGREQGWDSPIARYEFNPFLFPDPQAMIDEIKSQHFQIMCHQYPQTGKDAEGYEEFEKNGYGVKLADGSMLIFNECSPDWDNAYVDFTNPAAREWWWWKVKKIYGMGVTSWWNDGGEGPEAGELYEGSYRKCHNVHDLFRDRLMYQKIRQDFPELRVALRCRCGYAGIHRYGVIIQPGDMDSGLDTLRAQIIKTLNSALSGNPFRGPDMGGHYSQIPGDGTVLGFHTYTGGESRTDEIYLRWIQFCAFSSIMWAHGHPERSKLPWMRGSRIEAILKRYIELRYRLLPYLYTNAWLACSRGEPLMRPLVMDYPDDENVHELGTEYLFGKNMLVAPVLAEGVGEWEVYLPEGKWIDFWTHREYAGRQAVKVAVDQETVPVFMRAGSITPLGPAVQYVAEKPWDALELLVYPGPEAEFVLYEDDGATYEYEKGEYALTRFNCDINDDGSIAIRLGKTEGDYRGMIATRDYLIRVYTPAAPARVAVDGVPLGMAPDAVDGWWFDEKGFTVLRLSRISRAVQVDIQFPGTSGTEKIGSLAYFIYHNH